MNNFERIQSLSPAELADLFAETFCPYQETDNCVNKDCSDCFLKWLNETVFRRRHTRLYKRHDRQERCLRSCCKNFEIPFSAIKL